MTQLAARWKEVRWFGETEINTWVKTKAGVTMCICFPLTVNSASPWGSDLDAVTQLYTEDSPTSLPPSLQPRRWGSFCSSGIIWVDRRWGWVEGGSLCESVHLKPCCLPPPAQAMRHLQPTVGASSTCWSPGAPAGQGYQTDERIRLHSAVLHSHAQSAIYSFLLVGPTMSGYGFPWHSKLFTDRYPLSTASCCRGIWNRKYFCRWLQLKIQTAHELHTTGH